MSAVGVYIGFTYTEVYVEVYGYTSEEGTRGIRRGRFTWYALVVVYVYTPVGGMRGIRRGRCTRNTLVNVCGYTPGGGVRGGIRLWRDHHMRY